MSTQYSAPIIYGFPAEGKVGDGYLYEWLDNTICEDLTAGYYDRPDHFVGVVVKQVRDFLYNTSWTQVDSLLTVSDETARQVEEVRAALVAVDPKVVLGPVGFYLVGSSS